MFVLKWRGGLSSRHGAFHRLAIIGNVEGRVGDDNDVKIAFRFIIVIGVDNHIRVDFVFVEVVIDRSWIEV